MMRLSPVMSHDASVMASRFASSPFKLDDTQTAHEHLTTLHRYITPRADGPPPQSMQTRDAQRLRMQTRPQKFQPSWPVLTYGHTCECRCLAALAEWSKLTSECRKEWKHAEPHVRRDMAGLAAHAAWHMGHWDEMAVYTADMRTMESSTAAFLTSVQAVHNQNFGAAKRALPQGCLVTH